MVQLHVDRSNHITLEVHRRTVHRRRGLGDVVMITHIPFSVLGLHLVETPEESFTARYSKSTYSPIKALEKYVQFSKVYGASEQVVSSLTNNQPTEEEMQRMLITEVEPAPIKNPEPTLSKPKEKILSEPKGRKPSASSRFKDLIMAGELTDDEIFLKVQAEFNLSQNKRGYVGWYRNYLEKKGMNPPDPLPENLNKNKSEKTASVKLKVTRAEKPKVLAVVKKTVTKKGTKP